MRDRSSRLKAPRVNGIARHFEGWQVAALAVFIPLVVALIVVPRPVAPTELPEPRFDGRAIARAEERDDDLAKAAEREGLDADVRALGSAMRAFGRADAEVSHEDKTALHQRVVTAAFGAMSQGELAVTKLRAFELREFLRAVRAWEATGEETTDLVELGGGFLRAMRRGERLRGRELEMDEHALRASFKLRWNEITGVVGPSLEVSLDERRALYRFLLAHPPLPHDADAPPQAIQSFEDNFRLKKLDEIAKIDPSYPVDLARGVLHFRLTKYALALQDFRRYLEANPDGPYTLRAQNYMSATLGRTKTPDL